VQPAGRLEHPQGRPPPARELREQLACGHDRVATRSNRVCARTASRDDFPADATGRQW
jgi:hypothetical protein